MTPHGKSVIINRGQQLTKENNMSYQMQNIINQLLDLQATSEYEITRADLTDDLAQAYIAQTLENTDLSVEEMWDVAEEGVYFTEEDLKAYLGE